MLGLPLAPPAMGEAVQAKLVRPSNSAKFPAAPALAAVTVTWLPTAPAVTPGFDVPRVIAAARFDAAVAAVPSSAKLFPVFTGVTAAVVCETEKPELVSLSAKLFP